MPIDTAAFTRARRALAHATTRRRRRARVPPCASCARSRALARGRLDAVRRRVKASQLSARHLVINVHAPTTRISERERARARG